MMSIDTLRRGLVAGFAGTAAMATTTVVQRTMSSRKGPLDYDDSLISVELAERWTPLDVHGRTRDVVNQVMRFGYGSTGGLLRHAIDGRVRHHTMTLFALMWGGEAALLRAVGAAPAPWRWKRSTLLTSLGQHVVYAYATDRAYRAGQPHAPMTTVVSDRDGSPPPTQTTPTKGERP